MVSCKATMEERFLGKDNFKELSEYIVDTLIKHSDHFYSSLKRVSDSDEPLSRDDIVDLVKSCYNTACFESEFQMLDLYDMVHYLGKKVIELESLIKETNE